MGTGVHSERRKRGRALAFGLALLTLTACAPSFVRPSGERASVFPYSAFGNFLVKGSKGSNRGMWEISAFTGSHYRLTLYSSVGTLIGCTEVEGKGHRPCKRGMKDLANTKAWHSLPRELFSKLPELLSGDLPTEEGELTLHTTSGTTMKIRMFQRAEEPFPHPIFIRVRVSRGNAELFMRIQVEEVSRIAQNDI